MRVARVATVVVGVFGLGGCPGAEVGQQSLDNEALAALDETTLDPIGMQVRRVALKDANTICGEVNRKLKGGEYEGFQVFLVDRKSGKAIVAEPYALHTTDGEKPIDVCANAEQKRRYAERKGQAEAEFSRELDAFERETRIRELEAKLALESSRQ